MNQGSCVALLSPAVIQEQCENNRKRKTDNSFAVAVQAISRRVWQSVERKRKKKKQRLLLDKQFLVLFYSRTPD